MIHREDRDGLAVLRMEHGKANAFDVEFSHDLRQAFEQAHDAKAVVLTGTGSIFSAGVDLFRVIDGGAAYIEQFLPAFDGVLAEVFRFERPVIAAMNGHAIAGGCILACACDHRIMASGRGQVGIPELAVGVPFPAFALEIVRFAVPSHHAQEVIYTSKTFGPEESAQRGLVDRVVAPEQVLAAALETASALANVPPDVFALTKRMLRAPALERVAHHGSADSITDLWTRPSTIAVIRDYLARTLKK